MNNQRRHELERNVLAEKMGDGLDRVQPLVKPIIFGALALAVGFFGYQFIKGRASSVESQNWTKFYFERSGGDADSYAALGSLIGNKPSGQWSLHAAAQGYLRDGIEAIYTNRKEGVSNIKSAIAEWEKVKDSSIVELRSAALLGLAQAHESLGEIEQAIKYYQTVVNDPTTSEMQRQKFNEQLAYLKSPEAKNFYEWFNKLDPKPAAPPVFSGDLSLPPATPSISLDPNNLPNFVPQPPDTAPSSTGSETPAPTGTPAAGDSPTATASPTPPETPAAETPAPETPSASVPAETPAPTATAEPTAPAETPSTLPSADSPTIDK